jgi:hypothetical protein
VRTLIVTPHSVHSKIAPIKRGGGGEKYIYYYFLASCVARFQKVRRGENDFVLHIKLCQASLLFNTLTFYKLIWRHLYVQSDRVTTKKLNSTHISSVDRSVSTNPYLLREQINQLH